MTRILVVDDKEENRYYLEALLTGHGHDVVLARHGAEALTMARQQPPEVIVSDLLMPVMDGYTLLRHWKSDALLQGIPFVVYTATYTKSADEKLAFDLGADAFILKPAEPDEFIQRIGEVLEKPVSSAPNPPQSERVDETDVLRHYSETLIRKLEEKSLQLEQSNDALQADIQRREAAETALRQSEERFRLLARATNDAVWDWDVIADTRWWGAGFADLFGYAHGQMASDKHSWAELIHPEDREGVLDALQYTLDNGAETWSAEYRFQRADGGWADVEDRGFLLRDEGGRATRMVGGLSDVSERKAFEARAHKSRRLEALGQLTGGVAHDFNNLLTVVLGNAETLVEQLREHPRLRDLAHMIVEAAERGADLTRRLLAFARKQTLEPRPVDLNQLVEDLDPLLRRVLSGAIEVQYQRKPDLPAALVDPGQLEHVLLNLCLNARDAMPDGGSLCITTGVRQLELDNMPSGASLTPGHYVYVAVSDTGNGIEEQFLERIFEPFFTTKEEGKGTGLGLAMVYGFAKQSAGHVQLETEVGKGSCFTVYLPVANEARPSTSRPEAESFLSPGRATVLLVEDDNHVRDYARQQLQSLGYTVHTSESARQALELLDDEIPVDLLFSDVVMPGMSGYELAARVRELRPGIRLLLTSGYPGAAARTGDPEIPLLKKPYRREDLARALKEVLGPAAS